MHNAQHTNPNGRTVTLRLPNVSGLSVQTLILLLLIGVGVLQTAQLYGLKASVANAKVNAAVTTTGGSGSSGSSLPTMVGGC